LPKPTFQTCAGPKWIIFWIDWLAYVNLIATDFIRAAIANVRRLINFRSAYFALNLLDNDRQWPTQLLDATALLSHPHIKYGLRSPERHQGIVCAYARLCYWNQLPQGFGQYHIIHFWESTWPHVSPHIT
jgi:hypothetical protein